MTSDNLVRCLHADPAGSPTFCIDCLKSSCLGAVEGDRKTLVELLERRAKDVSYSDDVRRALSVVLEPVKTANLIGIRGPSILKQYRNCVVWSIIDRPPFRFFASELSKPGHFWRGAIPFTNMRQCGMLGHPVMFDATEFRLYPACEPGEKFPDEYVQAFAKILARARLSECMGFGCQHAHLDSCRPDIEASKRWVPLRRFGSPQYAPLLDPENPMNFRESDALRSEINVRRISYFSVEPRKKRLQGYDIVSWDLEAPWSRMWDDLPTPFPLLAMLVGDLWCPPSEDER